MISRTLKSGSLALLVAAATISCAGPGYYVQAASGQWKLMRARQDIDEVLASPATDVDLASRLQTARAILEYAGTSLGLAAEGSYDSYVETGRDAVVWNVVATPEFSLAARQWCFPVAGCVPYRGYFEEEKALRSADKLRRRGLDVAVSPARAYSTLGWFRDPLLDTMLHDSDSQLAATIIHELSHQRLYVDSDTAFNESYASFVEFAGVRAWLVQAGLAESGRNWTSRRESINEFNALLGNARQRLIRLYDSKTGEDEMRQSKREIFERLHSEYRDLRDTAWEGRDYFGNWFKSEINNARLALFQSYQGGVCAFSRLFEEAGGDFIEFHRLAGIQARLGKDERANWLNQSCSAIASRGDL